MTLSDVLSYGPIIYPTFSDSSKLDEVNVLITINGSYLNAWVKAGVVFTNTECRYVGENIGVLTLDEIENRARSFYQFLTEEIYEN